MHICNLAEYFQIALQWKFAPLLKVDWWLDSIWKASQESSLFHYLDWNLQSCEMWEWPVSSTMLRVVEKALLERQTKADYTEIGDITLQEEEIQQTAG